MPDLIPHGTTCPTCLHPWWAHLAQHEVPRPGPPHCIGQDCRCVNRQAGGVKRS